MSAAARPPEGGRSVPPGGTRAAEGAPVPRAAARTTRGFTLIEVIVALAVVAIALGAGIKAAGALASNAARLSDVVISQWCADNALSGLKLAQQVPAVGDTDFECEQLGRVYRGTLITRTTLNPNFRRVDVQMKDESQHVILTLSTVLERR